MKEWIRLARARPIVQRAAACAGVVGSILNAINHGDAILRGDMSAGRLLRMILTALVPYCVSTFSSVQALRNVP